MTWLDGTSGQRAHSRLEPLDEAVFSKSGVLGISSGAGRFYVPRAASILKVTAAVGTAPTGQPLLVDVNLNGVTVFTTQANRPSIAAGAFKVAAGAVPDVTTLVEGDLLSVDIDQVGSGVAGSDLSVFVLMSVS